MICIDIKFEFRITSYNVCYTKLLRMMKAFSGIDANVMQSLSNMGMKPDKLIAIAFQELAEKDDKIGQLNISPDLLQGLLQGSDR